MPEPSNFDREDWVSRWDIQSVPDFDDKVRECEYFFGQLATEMDRSRFRWLLSAFLNAAYSFFESTALAAHFRFADADGNPYKDDEGLSVLRRHVKVEQSKRKPEYVKTTGVTPLTTQLYEIRKKCTHHVALSVMVTGPVLPEDFQLGYIVDQGTPAMAFCREVLGLILDIHAEIDW